MISETGADRYEWAKFDSFDTILLETANASLRTLKHNLVVVSENDVESVRKVACSLQRYHEEHTESLDDMAYTMGAQGKNFPYRSFSVSDGRGPLEFSAPSKTPSTMPPLTFVFTSQGAQWATMGKTLLNDFPSVNEDFQVLDHVLSKLPHPPSWTIGGS